MKNFAGLLLFELSVSRFDSDIRQQHCCNLASFPSLPPTIGRRRRPPPPTLCNSTRQSRPDAGSQPVTVHSRRDEIKSSRGERERRGGVTLKQHYLRGFLSFVQYSFSFFSEIKSRCECKKRQRLEREERRRDADD